jgi:signal transduction histidine kinase
VIVLDIAVGVTFLLTASALRRTPRLALLAGATGLAWFAGDFIEALVFAHRAPLTHLLLLYPSARFRSRPSRWVVAAVYPICLIYPLSQYGLTTVVIFVAVLVAAIANWRRTTGARRSATVASGTAVLLWGLLAAGALARRSGAQHDTEFLATYEVLLIAISAFLVLDDHYRRSRSAIVTNLAVDLGEARVESLRDAIAEALGDPSAVLALVSRDGFTDVAGRPLILGSRPSQVITEVVDDGRRIAVLEHDPALLRDRKLLNSVAALAAIALANARLDEEVTASIAQMAASRRRLVAVAAAERDRLEAELHDRVLARLARVQTLLLQVGSAELCRQIEMSQTIVSEFARGLYPRALDEVGLGAIRDIDIANPDTILVPHERFAPEIEAAAYFCCLEALTNAAKHAPGSVTSVLVTAAGGQLLILITDDGGGGADPAKGTGLSGLQDRLAVLDGRLAVTTSASGTTVRATIPLVDAPGLLASS